MSETKTSIGVSLSLSFCENGFFMSGLRARRACCRTCIARPRGSSLAARSGPAGSRRARAGRGSTGRTGRGTMEGTSQGRRVAPSALVPVIPAAFLPLPDRFPRIQPLHISSKTRLNSNGCFGTWKGDCKWHRHRLLSIKMACVASAKRTR